MPQDAFTLNYLSKELNILTGGKINKVCQPAQDEILIFINCGYNTHKLVISANANFSRCHLTAYEKPNPANAYNFCMLLRKHLIGGVIKEVSLVEGERIIKFEITNKNEMSDVKTKCLYAELMGRFSNIVLTENGVILGACKTTQLDKDSKRILLSNFKYLLPPLTNKYNINDKEKLIAEIEKDYLHNPSEFIFNKISGISAVTAKEFAFLIKESEPELIYEKLCGLFYSSEVSPCVLKDGQKLVDYFVYPYHSTPSKECRDSGGTVHFETISKCLDYYFNSKEGSEAFSRLKTKLESAVRGYEHKIIRKLDIINNSDKACADSELNRIKGELIISNIYKVPKGAESIALDNYYDENKVLTVALDKNLTPSKNAERYYKKYNKQKKTLEHNKILKEELELELNYCGSVYEEIKRCENTEDLTEIENELINAGILKETKNEKRKTKNEGIGFLKFEKDGFVIKVGKNNIQNEQITFSAKAEDIWLHVKNYHGSHVVIETGGKKVSENIIYFAAQKAVQYSEARDNDKIEVDYTFKKNVKKISGAKTGLVNYTDYKTIQVGRN